MSKRRKLIGFFLATSGIIIFWIIAILAVIIARGNAINEDGVQATGTIRLQVQPSNNITAYLDEQQKSLTNEQTIEGIIPGKYTLKITKTDYQTWQQKVEVNAGLVTDVSVQLFPAEIPLEQITQTNIKQTFYSNNGRYVYYSVVNSPLGSQVGIWRQTLERGLLPIIEEQPLKITNLTKEIQKPAQQGELKIVPSPDASRLLIKTPEQYFILDAGRYNEPSEQNLLDLELPVEKVSWLEDSNNLLLQTENLHAEYHLDNGAITLINYGNYPQAFLNNTLVTVKHQDLYRYQNRLQEKIQLENIELPKNISEIYGAKKRQDNLIIKNDGGLHFLNLQESLLTKIGDYRVISVSPNATHLIVKEQDEIKGVDINISLLRNNVDITIYDTEIKNVDKDSIVWENAGNFFLFQKHQEENKLFTADHTGNNVNEILNNKSLTNLNYGISADSSEIIVALQDTQNNLQKMEQKRINLYKLSLNN